ncbi:hypothetical protein D9619_010987 [Psilocybe cf. subviscida]|uniref:Nephrocystin 3-like N-terminal domain-containing protein n=1 Tax=Psilocybe cf. subviscida TaxID=2480587 RepID=A0A8H5B989_9AGAR|nr:hypothetical protein D9619_010987 [Psilocybe cf. subviscida]
MASLFHGISNVSISGGTFVINDFKTQIAASSAQDKLSAATAHGALHNSAVRSDVSKCHRGTRTRVLHFCSRWAKGASHEGVSVLWLKGGAGAGKSAIMQTLAVWCARQELLLGGFFFSRTDPTRNIADVLIPTLVYQLTILYPFVMEVLSPIIEQDPLIFKKSLMDQLIGLLVPPLRYIVQCGAIGGEPRLPGIFIIDALDECNHSQQQQSIIQMIAVVLYDHSIPVKFLISSRPEHTISDALLFLRQRYKFVTMISLSDEVDAEADILKFIEDRFSKICRTHPFRGNIPTGWPPVGDVKTLVEKSSSHFIYASTVMKYIASTKELPVRSLQVVLGLRVSRTGSPFADLDALYHHILGSAAYTDQVLQILALCIYSSLPPFLSIISHMLGWPYDDVELFLFDMVALVQVGELYPMTNGVQLLHASLGDFLRNQSRSQALYIDEAAYHASSMVQCFALLDRFSQYGVSIRPQWPITSGRTGYDYSLLGKQIFLSITKLGVGVEARNILKQYDLHAFHDRIIRLAPDEDFLGEAESILNYVEAVRLAGIDDGGYLCRVTLEQFFDILQFYLEKDIGQVASAILPMIFSGYSMAAIRNIVFHCGGENPSWCREETTSYLLMCDTTSMVTGKDMPPIFDNLNLGILNSARHRVHASAQRMAVAAQVMLEYVSRHQPRPPFSKATLLQTPHKLWLRSRKTGKHIATGSPKLASAFHRQCRNYRLNDKPLPHKYYSKRLHNYLGLLLLPETPSSDICSLLLLEAILWTLPKAAHCDGLLRYAGMTFPRAVYQRSPTLARRVLRCLDMYNTTVREAKLSKLATRIDNGSPNALMERAQFYDVNRQD